jgi:hypothetical protein
VRRSRFMFLGRDNLEEEVYLDCPPGFEIRFLNGSINPVTPNRPIAVTRQL